MNKCLVFLALFLIPASASAWEQTMTCGDTAPCPEGQSPLPTAWKSPCVAFHLNQNGTSHMSFLDVTNTVKTSIQTWNRPALSSLTPHFSGNTDEDRIGYNPYFPANNANIIVFRDENWQESRAIMALTTVTHHISTGQIFDADIEINTTNYKYGIVEKDGSHVVDLQNTLTHEIGHVFGFAHSSVQDATMFPYSGTGETNLRSLAQDDLSALVAIYPPDKNISCTFDDQFYKRPWYEMDYMPPAQYESCSASPLSSRTPAPFFIAFFLFPLIYIYRKQHHE